MSGFLMFQFLKGRFSDPLCIGILEQNKGTIGFNIKYIIDAKTRFVSDLNRLQI